MTVDTLNRATRRAVHLAMFPRLAKPLSKQDQSTLSRLVDAARCYARARPDARSFCHRGKRFLLHQFDCWLIVSTWSGTPIAGPIRVREGAL